MTVGLMATVEDFTRMAATTLVWLWAVLAMALAGLSIRIHPFKKAIGIWAYSKKAKLNKKSRINSIIEIVGRFLQKIKEVKVTVESYL